MDDKRQNLLPFFLQEALGEVRAIEDFLSHSTSGRCDLTSLQAALSASSALAKTANLVGAGAIGKVAKCVEEVLNKLLKKNKSMTGLEFDALLLAQDRLRLLLGCLKAGQCEPLGIAQGVRQVFDLVAAFPGKSASCQFVEGGAADNDPFACDADFDFPEYGLRGESSVLVLDEEGQPDNISIDVPEDIFSEDDMFDLVSVGRDRSVLLPTKKPIGHTIDPFADDPVFDPVSF